MSKLFTAGLIIIVLVIVVVAVSLVITNSMETGRPAVTNLPSPTATPTPSATATATPVPQPINFYENVDVVATSGGTCILGNSKNIDCWGQSNYGELEEVPPSLFKAVEAGANHLCAVNLNDSVECWGDDTFGQSSPPEGRFESIALADYYSCGIREGGTIACWGDSTIIEGIPQGEFQLVAPGLFHVCALDIEGYPSCWGKNFAGQTDAPMVQFQSVSAGANHVCGLRLDGMVQCWGQEQDGQTVPPATTFVKLESGRLRTCGIGEEGEIVCWGNNEYGQSSPPSDLAAEDLGLGWFHTCALLANGFTQCWGNNRHGQFPPLDVVQANLPEVTSPPVAEPTPVPTPTQLPNTPLPQPEPTPTTPGTDERLTLPAIVQLVQDSVVRVASSGGTGSGWIYRTDGLRAWVLTNQHVIGGDSSPNIFIGSLNERFQGEVVGSDASKDLAVVVICCSERFRSAALGSSEDLQLGEEVLALGYPLGEFSIRVTRGIISSEEIYEQRNDRYLRQTDAAINPGNSGGPLVDGNGRVIGINTERIEFSISGRPVEATGFAVTEQTISESISQLESGRLSLPSVTPTPEASLQPDFGTGPTVRFGPRDGSITHEPSNAFIESFYTDIDVSNFYASATIQNPYSASTTRWDFCIGFRDQNTADGDFQFVVIDSDERYRHNDREDGDDTLISSGNVDGLNLFQAEENSVLLVAIEDRGWLFVNNVLITDLDLTDNVRSGDVWLGVGCTRGNELPGAVTRFEDFYVEGLNDDSLFPQGTLIGEERFISVDYTGLDTSAAYIKADFINPLASNWSYGFIFRNTRGNHFYSVIIDDQEFWSVSRRSGSASDETTIAEGRHRPIRTITDDINEVAFLYLGRVGVLYVNDTLVDTFTIGGSEEGDVGIGGWFFASDTQDEPIRYHDFEVWQIR